MDQLRVTAAYFVRESDLTKAAKLQIMNFLENEATDAQVMALLLDGKIQTLDEMAETIVYDRFDAALLEGKFGAAAKAAWDAAKGSAKKGAIATGRAGVGVVKKVPSKYRYAVGDAARATEKGVKRAAGKAKSGAKFWVGGGKQTGLTRAAYLTAKDPRRAAATAGKTARGAFKKTAAKIKSSLK